MTDIPKDAKCCKRIFSGSMIGHLCLATAKVERDGNFYCKRHDPEEVARKDKERAAKWNERWVNRSAAIDAAAAKQAALELDAARYRWLRDKARIEGRDGGYTGFYRLPFVDAWDDTPYSASRGNGFRFENLDAAIDVAMKA